MQVGCLITSLRQLSTGVTEVAEEQAELIEGPLEAFRGKIGASSIIVRHHSLPAVTMPTSTCEVYYDSGFSRSMNPFLSPQLRAPSPITPV